MSKTLHLTLKKKWFDMIDQGIKKEEYRQLKKYWAHRFVLNSVFVGLNKGLLAFQEGSYLKDFMPSKFTNYDTITFSLGYQKNRRQIVIEFKGIHIGPGKTEWGAEKDEDYFVLKLGEILTRKNF